MDNANVHLAIRIWSKPFSVDTVQTPKGKTYSLVNLPFYLIGHLYQIIEELEGRNLEM